MNRRSFLLAGAAGLLAGCGPTRAPSEPRARELTIRVHTDRRHGWMGADTLGLSFEASLLSAPDVFTPDNASLIALIRRLAPNGVIRLGGNDSEFCRWTREDADRITAPYQALIRTADIERFVAFLDACDWRAIYGINLGHGEPERAADEAAYVIERLGTRLVALQIGNEPDLYTRNGLRPADYSAGNYIDEWQCYAEALRRRVPDAPLAGPDVASRTDWVETFAAREGSGVRFLSCHYYATGPAEDPQVDIASMFAWPLPRVRDFDRIAAAAHATAQRWWLTEGNSCYNHGRPGVSDTLAAALWAVCTVFDLALRDCVGMCFHCGAGRPYTVLDFDHASGRWQPKPLYYGLLLVGQMLGAHAVAVDGSDAQLRAYATADPQGHISVVAVNVDPERACRVTIDADHPLGAGRSLTLSGPALEAKSGVVLGGAAVDGAGLWQPRWSRLPSDSRGTLLTVPAASAVLARFDA